MEKKKKSIKAKIDSYTKINEEPNKIYPSKSTGITGEDVKNYTLPKIMKILKDGLNLES